MSIYDQCRKCARRFQSYWHQTYCLREAGRSANRHTDTPKNDSDKKAYESVQHYQLVLDYDQLPPHLRLRDRMHLEKARLGKRNGANGVSE